ncbi:MAG: DUF2892 domain-containing protein [Acidobacteria bacterium]|nr:DUF2892 domain-containing protein [Acidobacteriota bacterium]
MFYLKNLPSWERVARATMGFAIAIAGLILMPETTAGYALAATGAMTALTGFAGFCPMCAMVGRKLKVRS